MRSILQTEKVCFLCGGTPVEEHHIYFGHGLREKSERHGFKCFLCQYHHRDSKGGVHGNRQIDLMLKRVCQEEYEKTHSRQEWMKLIKRNYL